MSLIPQNAVGLALTALQRPQNDAAVARRAQLQKRLHHAEDINELDDTAVDTISDNSDNDSHEQQQEEPARHQAEDLVEITSLAASAHPIPPTAPPSSISSLDISA